MGFVRADKHQFLRIGREYFFVVGMNYLPRHHGIFWDNWQPEMLREDLKRMSKSGINTIRFPMHWAFMEPQPGKFNPVIFQEFEELISIAKENNLYLMPWFLVGVCCGIYEIPYRKGRSIYGKEMLECEKNLLKNFISRYKNEKQILAWDIADEPYFFGGFPEPEDGAKWVAELYQAIKSVDKNHLVTIGLHFGAPAQDTGIRPEMIEKNQDILSTGTAPLIQGELITNMKNTYYTSFFVLFHRLNKPSLLSEGPMYPTTKASEDEVARHHRVAMFETAQKYGRY